MDDVITVERALGWDWQLKDKPGANLVLTRLWRLNRPLRPAEPLGLAIGFVPEISARVANVQTYASAGLTVRNGSNLEADFGKPRISPAPDNCGFFQPDGRWDWYAFACGGGRAVITDLFHDGNAWRDSPSVDKRHFVGDSVAGLGIVTLRGTARLQPHLAQPRVSDVAGAAAVWLDHPVVPALTARRSAGAHAPAALIWSSAFAAEKFGMPARRCCSL